MAAADRSPGTYPLGLMGMLALVIAIGLAGCGGGGDNDGAMTVTPEADETAGAPDGALVGLSSDAFAADQAIPSRFTCDGDDVSPVLFWGGAPAGTQSFALIMDDPDAPIGVFTHWLIYNIGSQARSLPEGVEKTERPANGAGGLQGRNDFGRSGYGGPCPPGGTPHRYRFQLYALDEMLGLGPGASKQELLDAMQGHILETTTHTGTYGR